MRKEKSCNKFRRDREGETLIFEVDGGFSYGKNFVGVRKGKIEFAKFLKERISLRDCLCMKETNLMSSECRSCTKYY